MNDFEMLNTFDYDPNDIYNPLNYSDREREASDLMREIEQLEHSAYPQDIECLYKRLDDLEKVERSRAIRLRYVLAKKKQEVERMAACAAVRKM